MLERERERERANFLADRTQPRTQTGGQRRPVKYIFEHLLSREEGVWSRPRAPTIRARQKAGKAEQARIVWFSLAGELQACGGGQCPKDGGGSVSIMGYMLLGRVGGGRVGGSGWCLVWSLRRVTSMGYGANVDAGRH